MKPPILMLHGAFTGGWCFDAFRQGFEAAGHMVSAPDLPGHAPRVVGAPIFGDQSTGGQGVAGLTLREYTDAAMAAARAMPAAPVIVGHSMGGLIAQLVAGRMDVAGLILLSPSPAWGQPTTSAMEMGAAFALPAFCGPYWLQAISPEYTTARSLTFDRLDEITARALYAKMVPESGHALFQVVNWWMDATAGSLVGASASRPPALVLVGAGDQVNTPSTAQATAARLGAPCRVLSNLSHWLMSGPGSDAVVAASLAWLEGLAVAA